MIEMFNAVNALSEEKSLLTTGLFSNILLLLAIALSTLLHLLILYNEFFEHIFETEPLSRNDWIIVIAISAPVILLDEFVKIFARAATAKRLAEIHKKRR